MCVLGMSRTRSWLASQARGFQQVRLIVNGTEIGFAHQLLIAIKAFRKPAFSTSNLDCAFIERQLIRAYPCQNNLCVNR